MKTSNNIYAAVILLVKLLPIILILAAASFSNAQGLKASTYVERTKVSPKMGHSIGIVFPGYLGDIEVGGFYQKTMFYKQEPTSNKVIEDEFYGFYLGVSFIHTERLNLNFNIRTGTVNDKFLVITPSVFSDVMISRSLGFGFGLGLRSLQPTYTARVILKLNDVNHAFTKKTYSQRTSYKYR